MGILDDTTIFTAVVLKGGFSHAAKYLGLSNGLISRRISKLESELGTSLIKRTTRQFKLTPEGELFWRHAQRIQQELDTAITLIHSAAKKPKGTIRISAPLYFGRTYLTPIIMKFLSDFNDIKIDLILSNQLLDPIKEHLDLVIRGAGYIDAATLKDSNLKMKILFKEKIGLYASPIYLQKFGEPKNPEALFNHTTINYIDAGKSLKQEKWKYIYKNKANEIRLDPKFRYNDIESGLIACIAGYGIGKFTELNVKNALQKQQLCRVLQQYDWGQYNLYVIYSQQQALPQRTRLLLEFINTHTKFFSENISD